MVGVLFLNFLKFTLMEFTIVEYTEIELTYGGIYLKLFRIKC